MARKAFFPLGLTPATRQNRTIHLAISSPSLGLSKSAEVSSDATPSPAPPRVPNQKCPLPICHQPIIPPMAKIEYHPPIGTNIINFLLISQTSHCPLVAHPWPTCGPPMAHPWPTCGPPATYPWPICGQPMASEKLYKFLVAHRPSVTNLSSHQWQNLNIILQSDQILLLFH